MQRMRYLVAAAALLLMALLGTHAHAFFDQGFKCFAALSLRFVERAQAGLPDLLGRVFHRA